MIRAARVVAGLIELFVFMRGSIAAKNWEGNKNPPKSLGRPK